MRRCLLLVSAGAALAAAALATAATPAGAARAGFRTALADSDWVSWRAGETTYRYFAFKVSATGSTLQIAAAERLPWAGSRGCPIEPGTVVYSLTRVGVDASGNALYNGTALGWDTSAGTCTTTGLASQVSAVLKAGEDASQKPPLAFGHDNVLDVYAGTVAAGKGVSSSADDVFYRKGGTAAAGAAGATTPLARSAKAPAWDVSGTWSATPGILTLTQIGSSLKGTFRMRAGCLESYAATGTVSGSAVKLALRRANGAGDAPPCAGTQTLNGTVAASGTSLSLALVNAHQASPPTRFTGKAKRKA